MEPETRRKIAAAFGELDEAKRRQQQELQGKREAYERQQRQLDEVAAAEGREPAQLPVPEELLENPPEPPSQTAILITDGSEPAEPPPAPPALPGGSTRGAEDGMAPPPSPANGFAKPIEGPAADAAISYQAWELALRRADAEAVEWLGDLGRQFCSWLWSVRGDGIVIACQDGHLQFERGSASPWTWDIRRGDMVHFRGAIETLLSLVGQEMGL